MWYCYGFFCTHIHTHTLTHMHISPSLTYMHTYTYTYIQSHTYTRARSYIHTHFRYKTLWRYGSRSYFSRGASVPLSLVFAMLFISFFFLSPIWSQSSWTCDCCTRSHTFHFCHCVFVTGFAYDWIRGELNALTQLDYTRALDQVRASMPLFLFGLIIDCHMV